MNIGNSFSAQTTNYINQNKTNTEETLSKIGAMRELSGKDNANLIIANSLNTQISGLTQGIQNSNEVIGMMQIADSGVSELSKNNDKLNQLSIQYGNDALNSDQKQMLVQEFQATKDAMSDIVETTSYNGKALLSSEFNLQVTGLEELTIENQDDIASFQENLGSLHSEIGSVSNKNAVAIANSLSAVSNLTSAYGNISEEPMNVKINDLEKNQIKLESSILAQNHQTDMLQQRISALLV